MKIHTTFITRYVASHEANVPWYEAFFGRAADCAPVSNCREWHLDGGVVFQVIEAPSQQGETEFAFAVADLDAETGRQRSAGIDVDQPWAVEGFETLRFARASDPEGRSTGLLDSH